MTMREESHSPHVKQDPVGTTSLLLEAAAAEFIQHGYDKARVVDIARGAGVTVGAIYARWSDKTGVMVAALDHIFEQLLPEQRIKALDLEELPLSEIVQLWAADLLEPSSPREVFTQVFGSARNNVEVQARLQKYLEDQFDQISSMVDRSKVEGDTDPELSTAAIAIFMQALGVGVHMVMSGRSDESDALSPSDWMVLIRRLLDAARPTPAAAD